MRDNRITIRKVKVEYLVSPEHPLPQSLRQRMDGVLERRVSAALSRLLDANLPESDTGVLFIRSLPVALIINAEWDDDQVAADWAIAIGKALAGPLSCRGIDDSTAWFPSRPAYLAEFLRQAAAGTAWQRWYFTEFDGLRLLPNSAALRTALGRDPAEGLSALQLVAKPDLLTILRCMTTADARRALDSLFAAAGSDQDAYAAELRSAWLTDEFMATTREQEPAAALALCIGATRTDPALAGRPLKESALALTRLARLFSHESARYRAALRQALSGDDIASLYLAVGTGDAEALAPLFRWPSGLRTELLAEDRARHAGGRDDVESDRQESRRSSPDERTQPAEHGRPTGTGETDGRTEPTERAETFSSAADSARMNSAAADNSMSAFADGPHSEHLVREGGHSGFQQGELQFPFARNRDQNGPAAPEPLAGVDEGEWRATSLGGIFLLLPIIDELLPQEVFDGWPEPEMGDPGAIVRLLIASRCFGRERSFRALNDSLLRDMVGIPSTLPLAHLLSWVSAVSAPRWTGLMNTISDRVQRGRLPGRRSLLLARIAGPTAIAIDCRYGHWLLAAGYRRDRLQRLIDRAINAIEAVEADAIIVQDAALVEPLRSALRDRQIAAATEVVALDEIRGAQIAADETGLQEQLARLERVAGDLAFLVGPTGLHPTAVPDLAIRTAAQNVLRTFAMRLPGFAYSSLPYLYQNFLSFAATLEGEVSGRYVVRVGRPPLHLILNLTGMARSSYRLSWLDDRPFALFPE